MKRQSSLVCSAIMLVALCTINNDIMPCTSQQTQTQEQQITTEEYLHTLTNQQLEDICTERGFYLEPEEGFSAEDYSHEEYVDAAMQCLALEAEIEAAIAKNPEILEELKREADKMKEENAKLEAEVMRLLKENDTERPPSDEETTAFGVGSEASPEKDVDSDVPLDADGVDDVADVDSVGLDSKETEESLLSSVPATSLSDDPVEGITIETSIEDNETTADEEFFDLNEDERKSSTHATLDNSTAIAEDSDDAGSYSYLWRTLVKTYQRERVIIEKWLSMIDPVLSPVIAILRATLASMRDMGRRYTAAIIQMNEQRQEQQSEGSSTRSGEELSSCPASGCNA